MTPIETAFAWIEQTALSDWVSGPSMLAFPTIPSAHTLGMGFLAGTSAGIDLRLLGVAHRVPLSALEKFYPVIWLALVVNFASGTLLFIGYPYKAVTNPLFLPASVIGRGGFSPPGLAPSKVSADSIGVTGRALEVLYYLCQGLPNKAIANRMGIEESTVRKDYVPKLFRLFRVTRRTELLVEISRRGISIPTPSPTLSGR